MASKGNECTFHSSKERAPKSQPLLWLKQPNPLMILLTYRYKLSMTMQIDSMFVHSDKFHKRNNLTQSCRFIPNLFQKVFFLWKYFYIIAFVPHESHIRSVMAVDLQDVRAKLTNISTCKSIKKLNIHK